MGRLTEVDGGTAGDWIGIETDGGPGPLVKEQIPQRFDCYLRLFHPAVEKKGADVTWAEVSDQMGTVFHPLAQWDCIARSRVRARSPEQWEGGRPALGEMSPKLLDLLCSIVSRHTDAVSECFFGMSTILGKTRRTIAVQRPLELGQLRDYRVFTGPLCAAGQLGIDMTSASFERSHHRHRAKMTQSHPASRSEVSEEHGRPAELSYLNWQEGEAPNLMWPADRRWFVASEVDFDSTLIGGSAALAGELSDAQGLECLAVAPSASLAADADEINCPRNEGA
jgi:hypothetical protein